MTQAANGFILKVAEMRTAQKEYFKTRDNQWLNQSKKLEREVDKMLASLASPQKDLL